MRSRRLPFGKAVRVHWKDSKSLPGWRYNTNTQRQVAKIVTTGYVVQTNADGITVTTSISTEGVSLDDITIPWGCCVKIDLLGREWDRDYEAA